MFWLIRIDQIGKLCREKGGNKTIQCRHIDVPLKTHLSWRCIEPSYTSTVFILLQTSKRYWGFSCSLHHIIFIFLFYLAWLWSSLTFCYNHLHSLLLSTSKELIHPSLDGYTYVQTEENSSEETTVIIDRISSKLAKEEKVRDRYNQKRKGWRLVFRVLQRILWRPFHRSRNQ